MTTTIPPTASVPPAAPPVTPINDPFLKENSHAENLERLSNPKYSSLSYSIRGRGCVTREIYSKTPFSKPSKGLNQGPALLWLTLLPIFGSVYYNTISCTGLKDWRTNFFSVSSECFAQSLSGVTDRDYRVKFIFRGLLLSTLGLGMYAAGRLLFRDRNEQTRIQMLRAEYSGMADFFSASSKTGDTVALQKIRAIAARLKVNLPFIQKNLQAVTHIEPEEAALITHKLSKAVDRLLGVSR